MCYEFEVFYKLQKRIFEIDGMKHQNVASRYVSAGLKEALQMLFDTHPKEVSK